MPARIPRPGRLSAALGQYRALYTDAADKSGAGPLLTMPTLAVSGSDEARMSADGLRQVAVNVAEIGFPDAGHYEQEEQPERLAKALLSFLD